MRRTSTAASLAVVALLEGACGRRLPTMPPPRALEEYALSRTHDGIGVAVEPILDERSSKAVFALDLPRLGFLPVYVVVRNVAGRPVLLQKTGIQLLVPGETATPAGERPSLSSNSRTTAMRVLGWTAILALPVAAIPQLVLMDIEGRRSETTTRMTEFELPDRTLAPGQSAFGYVYLPIKERRALAGSMLVVRLPHVPPDDEGEEFSFDVGGPGEPE